jgi:hypothetical protein
MRQHLSICSSPQVSHAIPRTTNPSPKRIGGISQRPCRLVSRSRNYRGLLRACSLSWITPHNDLFGIIIGRSTAEANRWRAGTTTLQRPNTTDCTMVLIDELGIVYSANTQSIALLQLEILFTQHTVQLLDLLADDAKIVRQLACDQRCSNVSFSYQSYVVADMTHRMRTATRSPRPWQLPFQAQSA